MIGDLADSYDLNGYITEYVTHKLFDVASIGFKNALKRINRNKDIIKIERFDKEDCIEYISQHIKENINWATNVSFRDATKSKNLTDIFVELDLYITPLKLRADTKENTKTIPLSDLLSDTEKNIVLLGQPGAGKTTSAKKIFLELLMREEEVYDVFSFPLVIRLKDLQYNSDDKGLILFREILNTLGIFYSFEGTIDDRAKDKILNHIFKDFIERLDILIILDGYDEISDSKLREEVVRNLRLMTNSLMNSKYILTSRSADYDLHIENSSEYEICPLSEIQIRDFIERWLDDRSKSKVLLAQLQDSPYWDTTMRPLTLAHLCALYERNNLIPDRPKSVYKKIVHLLLEEWSNQRSIERKSKYAKFEVDRKTEFLARFAFELTVEFQRIAFSESTLSVIYREICHDFELPESDGREVVKEIESHNGLILQTGTDNYEFAHKSLLEYLVAEYLTRLPLPIKAIDILIRIPNELAIAVAISSNPNIALYELIYTTLGSESFNDSFLLSFLSRILIEKPDFKPDALFSMTNIYLTNVLVEQMHELTQKYNDEMVFESYDEAKEEEYHKAEYQERMNYYSECMEVILSFADNENFVNSLKDVTSYYKIGEVTLHKKSSKAGLERWGKVYHLKRFREKYRKQGVTVEIPEILYLVERFRREIV